MPNMTLIQNNFMSGEVSPLLEGQIGAPRYLTGLRLCQNFLPIRQGGLRKRPGTRYAGTTRSNAKSRLIEMTVAGNYFIIELSGLRARIWNSGYTIVGAPDELVTPWSESDLPGIKFRVMKGVLYIVHPFYAPRTITVSAGVWAINTPTFTGDRTFAAANTYPRAVFFHSGRLGLAGTNDEPNTIFLSRSPLSTTAVDRFQDFLLGTAADNAIYLQEADMNGTHICWCIGQRRLVLGTDRSIWMDNGQLVTPAGFDMNLVQYTGTEEIQPALLENIVLYVGRGGTSLHALMYSEEGGGFQDYNLSTDAEHFLSSPVVDMKVQTLPDPIVWVVRADGLLVSCTIDFKNGVIAWARHPMADGALVESVAIGSTATEDVIWLAVKRGAIRTIEYMCFSNLHAALQKDFHFVDNGLVFTYGSPANTVTGLTHLEGKEVAAWADGAVLPPKTVASGSVTYDCTFTTIHIGLAIESKMDTLRPETPANGTSQGKQKRIEKVAMRVFRSIGGLVSVVSGTDNKFLTMRAGTYIWGSIPNLYTGDISLEVAAILEPDATLKFTHREPAPFTLLAIIYRVALMEP